LLIGRSQLSDCCVELLYSDMHTLVVRRSAALWLPNDQAKSTFQPVPRVRDGLCKQTASRAGVSYRANDKDNVLARIRNNQVAARSYDECARKCQPGRQLPQTNCTNAGRTNQRSHLARCEFELSNCGVKCVGNVKIAQPICRHNFGRIKARGRPVTISTANLPRLASNGCHGSCAQVDLPNCAVGCIGDVEIPRWIQSDSGGVVKAGGSAYTIGTANFASRTRYCRNFQRGYLDLANCTVAPIRDVKISRVVTYYSRRPEKPSGSADTIRSTNHPGCPCQRSHLARSNYDFTNDSISCVGNIGIAEAIRGYACRKVETRVVSHAVIAPTSVSAAGECGHLAS
jgi:hypothetical protein